MAHDPRGCLFPSLGLCWETWSWAEQEASILGLNAVLVGPRVQSGGWALRGPGRQRGDLGESKTSAAGRDQSRGLRPWWTQRCAAQMLLFGRTCCPAVSSFWGENHLLPEGTAPSGGRSRDRGSWETGAAVVTSCGETTTWVTSSAPLGSGRYVGGPGSQANLPSAHPALSPPLTAVDAQQTPCKTTETDCELGYLEGRVGVSSEQMKTGEQRRPVPRPGGVSGVGGGVTEAGADQSFSTTSAEGLGMYKFILLFLNFLAMWHTRSSLTRDAQTPTLEL